MQPPFGSEQYTLLLIGKGCALCGIAMSNKEKPFFRVSKRFGGSGFTMPTVVFGVELYCNGNLFKTAVVLIASQKSAAVQRTFYNSNSRTYVKFCIKKPPQVGEVFIFKFSKLKLTGEVKEHSGAADLPEQA